MPDPTFLLINVPVAVTLKVSPETNPLNVTLFVLTVAVVVPSYTLLIPVTPLTVTVFLPIVNDFVKV